jgi:hypothetical protein
MMLKKIYKYFVFFIVFVSVVVLSGCESVPKSESQDVVGAGVASGASYYQQQGESISENLETSIGSSLGSALSGV